MELLRYFAITSATAAAFWLIYHAVLRNRNVHRANRIFLLSALMTAAILPAMRLPERLVPTAPQISITLPAFYTGSGAVAPSGQGINWVLAIWGCGCLLFASIYLTGYLQVRRAFRGKPRTRVAGYRMISQTGIGPGTLGRQIFIPGATIAAPVLDHELAHIRAGHRFDLAIILVSRILLWFSPAHWLLGRELKVVHEFEADAVACLNTAHEHYAKVLMQARLGIPQLFTTHAFFHHPLKRRIMMLRKNVAGHSKAAVAAAVILMTGFTGGMLFAQTRSATVANATTPLDPEALQRNYGGVQTGTVAMLTGGQMVFEKVDQMPRFNGELWNWLRSNGRAPEKDIEGKVTVQFTIDQTGAVVQPLITAPSPNARLNAEALRLVHAMPRWKPGVQRGAPVAVRYTLSIYFGGNAAGC